MDRLCPKFSAVSRCLLHPNILKIDVISISKLRNSNVATPGEGVENLDVKMEQICESPVRSKPRSLIVVVTEGCAPVQCYSIGDTQLKTVSVPVPSLDTSRIKVGPA